MPLIPSTLSIANQIGPVLSAIKTAARPQRLGPFASEPPPPPTPFVTISRQPGADGESLATMLVQRLNTLDDNPIKWTAWDRELIEKIAADHHISARLIESLEDTTRPWLSDLFGGLSCTADAGSDELVIYHRVAATIRGLASAGRVVIVGRAGVFITRKMSGGIHVRLVAPREHRVQNMARILHTDLHCASRRVAELDQARASFYRRHWPAESLAPERFTVTLNTSEVTDLSVVECIVPLIRLVNTPPEAGGSKGDRHAGSLHHALS